MAEKVILYSTGCPKCSVLKKKLGEKGVKDTENNSVDEMLALGITSVPTLSVDGELKGFSESVVWLGNQ